MKSEHNLYLACEDSPQRTFFFCTLSCYFLALLASIVHWLRCFLFLSVANHQLCSVLDSAKHIHCEGPTTLSCSSSTVKKHCSFLSPSLGIPACQCSLVPRPSITPNMLAVIEGLGTRLCQCTWRICMSSWVCMWLQIDIPECDRHVHMYIRTYIARIDPSLKALH